MALEDKIHVTKPSGESVDPPQSLEELRTSYYHGADLLAKPSNLDNSMGDLNRVITLRPNMKLRMGGGSDNSLFYRGIFAYGVKNRKHVNFEIYTPRQSQKKSSPTQALREAAAALSLALLESEYVITRIIYK